MCCISNDNIIEQNVVQIAETDEITGFNRQPHDRVTQNVYRSRVVLF